MRSRSGQRCSPSRNGRLARPCDRSTYTYTSSGRSPALLASFSRVPPRSARRNCGFVPKPCFCGLSARPSASPLKTLCVFRRLTGPDRDRAWHPRELGQGDACSSLASGKSSTPPARCIHHSRHDASSAGYRLLASFAPGVASREPESRRSPALTPRTRRLDPTFRCGAFFFVAPAFADVPSARLTLSAAKVPQRYPMLYDSSRRWLTLALFRPHHNLISNISSHSV